jgi:hypothetical protein
MEKQDMKLLVLMDRNRAEKASEVICKVGEAE